jgi:type VII secretion-associated serine protease mycosin
MGKQLRRYSAGVATAGALAGAALLAPPVTTHSERPASPKMSRGLTASPDQLLPSVVSAARPVRVVSTVLESGGRPVITVGTATDRNTAAALVRTGQRATGAVDVELDAPVRAADVPAGDDPLRSSQWDLATVRATDAWASSTGAAVTVAVIDSGVDATHPDLAGQVLPGADFITGTEGEAIDPNGHGTHVAGTIAALAGNGEGVAGLAPGARILPIRVLNANGGGYMSDVANGIVYATDRGADVISMSLSATIQVDAVTNAVAYAHSRGVVVVAAAGNARATGSPASYPAADPGVIAVAATDANDNVAYYSTQGSYVDVAAPGSDIVSTFPVATGMAYRRMSGTSMAAPHVAAVAALLKSYDRGLTPDQIEQAITGSAVDLGVPGRDDDFGSGRLDAAAALAAVTRPTPQPTTPQPTTPDQQPALDPTATIEPSPTEPTPTTPEPTPTTPEPSPTTPEPSPTTPEPSPTTPEPSPTTPAPEPTTPAPDVIVLVVRTRPGQLTIATQGADGLPAELQVQSGDDWETVQTFPAKLVTRIDDLTPGLTYRVVVAGVTSSTTQMF